MTVLKHNLQYHITDKNCDSDIDLVERNNAEEGIVEYKTSNNGR